MSRYTLGGVVLVSAVAAVTLSAGLAHAAPETNELPPEEAKPVAPPGVVVPVSIMGGIRFGGALEAGKNAPDDQSRPNGAIGGIDLALEVGATVFDHFYGGLLLGGTLFVSPQTTTSNISSLFVGTELAYITNPRGFGGLFGLGVAYRAIFVSDALGNANKFDGPDLLVTLGLHAKLGSLVRLIPRADLSLGPAGGVVHAIVTLGFSIWLTDDIHPKKRRH